jgi:hypothetical protein
MITFERLSARQRVAAITKIKQELLDSIIQGILDFEDSKLQAKVDALVEESASVEEARKKVSILLDMRLANMVIAIAETSLYDGQGEPIKEETLGK